MLHAAASQALDTWKDVTFNYASTDTPDFVADRHGRLSMKERHRPCASPRAAFSFLPDLTDEQIRAQVAILHSTMAGRSASSTPTTRIRATPTGRCAAIRCSTSRTPAGVMMELNDCRKAYRRPLHPRHRLRLDARAGSRCALSFIVNRPAERAGLPALRQEARRPQPSATRSRAYATDRPEGERYVEARSADAPHAASTAVTERRHARDGPSRDAPTASTCARSSRPPASTRCWTSSTAN